jgi:uncharacterized protein YprB with RNaseH-like and TPR domain
MRESELHEQLRRLGIGRGAGQLKARPRRERAIERLLPGEVVDTECGTFFQHCESYALDYRHGYHPLADLLAHSPLRPAFLARDERLATVALDRMAFIDTETTGLVGGTGTYAFLVGVGVFEGEQFTIYQFFMRDYDEEPAQFHALGKLLDGLEAVVSFNGKSFDLPLLETRFVMVRQPPRLIGAPHLDLLLPARRFWKYRLQSCALSSLESEVLGVRRTQADVPGWLIPSLYAEYARSGDACEMPRIFYHNAQDILSLVALTSQMCDLVSTPVPVGGSVPGEDLYGLGRFFQDLEQFDEAEAAFTQAAHACRSSLVREMAMRDLAYLLKRQERRAEALSWWKRLAETEGAVYACEELAKHYEWHDADLKQAAAWTECAIDLVKAWSPGPRRRDALAEFEHRLHRLKAKGVEPRSGSGGQVSARDDVQLDNRGELS